jgi:amino acid transporter
MILDMFGYDRLGEVREIKTTLHQNALNTRDVAIAAMGWQLAVPVDELAKIAENGDGGPSGAIARVYLPPSLSWIAVFVVITSAMAGLQVAMTAGARTAYRMAQEGHLPRIFGATNRYRAPWVGVVVIAYLMYSAGATPADPKDLYQAWYIGLGVLASSILLVIFGKGVSHGET